MVELPPFVSRANALFGSQSRSGGRSVPAAVRDLYAEFARCSGVPGWLESPRGIWISYQIDWVEGRR